MAGIDLTFPIKNEHKIVLRGGPGNNRVLRTYGRRDYILYAVSNIFTSTAPTNVPYSSNPRDLDPAYNTVYYRGTGERDKYGREIYRCK